MTGTDSPDADPTGWKFCPSCQTWKPYSEFNASRQHADKKQPECRLCQHPKSNYHKDLKRGSDDLVHQRAIEVLLRFVDTVLLLKESPEGLHPRHFSFLKEKAADARNISAEVDRRYQAQVLGTRPRPRTKRAADPTTITKPKAQKRKRRSRK